VGEAERQAALGERILRRHQFPDHGVAALAIEQLAGLERPFRGSDRIGAKPGGAAGGFAAQAYRSH